MSYRITTNFQDNSQTTLPSPDPVAATCIFSPKGKDGTALRFEKGEEKKILDLLGTPSSTYPAIQDVIDYNKKGAILVSAPKGTDALYGGVLVTKEGSVSLASGFDTKTELNNWGAIDQEEVIGVGDGVTTQFIHTISNFNYYLNTSVDILIGDVSQVVTATDVAEEILINASGDNGTFTRATGILDFTFDAAPAEGDVIKVNYQLDVLDKAYMILLSQSAQVDDLAVQVSSENPSEFSVALYRKDSDGIYNQFSASPYLVSLISNGKDGFGRPIFAENVFSDTNLYLQGLVNSDVQWDRFVDDVNIVDMGGGRRGVIQHSDVVEGFEVFTDTNAYPNIKIIFSSIADASIASKFEALRGNDASPGVLRYVKFLMPTGDSDYATISNDFIAHRYNINQRGINTFVGNWGIHLDLYNGKNFNCSMMGLIAGRYLDSQLVSSGGLSPSWVDEQGVGGFLGSSIVKLNRNYSQSQLENLQANGMNAIVKHPTLGPMIESDRTTQVNPVSDYSFTIHSDLADNIVYEIVTKVLPNQINKLIDERHLAQVRLLTDQIVGTYAAYLEEYIVVCDATNNTDETKAQRKFILTVGVKYTVNSQFIVFNFVNSPQGLSVEQTLGLTT